jgi:hypothetical protein
MIGKRHWFIFDLKGLQHVLGGVQMASLLLLEGARESSQLVHMMPLMIGGYVTMFAIR